MTTTNEAAERLVDALFNLWASHPVEDVWGEAQVMVEDALATERLNTVERLGEYATHDADCAHYRSELAACDCGLQAILDEVSGRG